MTLIFVALLPVFLVIVVGAIMQQAKLVDDQQWAALDQVCYKLLFPCLFFKEIAAADFGEQAVGYMAIAMMTAVCIMSAALIIVRKHLSATVNIGPPQFGSLFQGAVRWHTFIALAIIPTMFGQSAIALGAVGAASMTPLLNVIVVWVHAATLGDGKIDAKKTAVQIITNPFVYSTLAGVAWKVAGLPMPWPLFDVLDLIGKGALGLALLAVGAGLQFGALRQAKTPVAVAVGLKLLVMPVIMFCCVKLFGVTGDAAKVAIVCASTPGGSGAYVLAKQLGADAPMMANILTVQVFVAAFTIPLMLMLLT
jgi:malonate transporter and related proteins